MIIIHWGIRNELSTYDNDRRFIEGQKAATWTTRNRSHSTRFYAIHNTRRGWYWHNTKERKP